MSITRELICRCIAVLAIALTGASMWPAWTRHLGSCVVRPE
jgi:hypothetical protein